MRKVSQQSLGKTPYPLQDVVTKVIPSPTDGWDAISPLALMDPKRAPILTNWMPRPGWVELRAGYNIWSSTGPTYLTGDPVESLMVYRALGSEKLFAAAGGIIYDVSTAGTAVADVTGLVGNRWQYVNFEPAGGTMTLMCCNGVDQLHAYNGSWFIPVITGLPGGVSTSAIRNIYEQKQRIWFALNNGTGQGTTIAAYLGIESIQGAISGTLDLGTYWDQGGYLLAMADWTIDGGAGPNDYMCFISNKGQVAIYQGTDPSNANAWSLVGVFNLPPPIGDRCVVKIGSDVGVITLQGVLPLSTALPFDPSADRSAAITSRIQNAMSQSAGMYFSNFGWQLITYPAQTQLILNIPQAENSQQFQYVMNTLTGAWCQFQGWNANTFAIYNNQLYWGDNTGNVNEGYVGSSDLFNTINADMQCAFNYLDDPGRTKRMTMIEPLLVSSGNITPFLSIDTDFATSTTVAPITSPTAANALWDQAIWDSSQWPVGTINLTNWFSVDALGHAMAVRMKINFSGGLTVASGVFDFGQFDSALFDEGINTAAPLLQVNAFLSILEGGGFI